MKELSIFIDESGDFGGLSQHSPYYIISMVFHNQKYDISESIARLDYELSYLGFNNISIHTGPIIRKEEIYKDLDIAKRKRVLNKMMAFFRNLNVYYKCFYIVKRNTDTSNSISKDLRDQIIQFISSHFDILMNYDEIKIYYDNGQNEVQKILYSSFQLLSSKISFRKVMPIDYKLFQVADLICTLELLKLKMNNNSLSHSEKLFFCSKKDLKKNYLKYLSSKEIK